MAIPLAPQDSERYARLSDPALRRALESAVRRRLRADDADDIVQATLADVLAAGEVPVEPQEFRRFVFGVARNKVFDHYRRSRRELSEDRAGEPGTSEPATPEPPHAAGDILRWAEGTLPDSESKHTLEWMLREGDGEKLEQIAREANLPAPRVRQRVSRLRRFLRERWAAELALLTVLFVGLGFYLYARHKAPEVRREPLPPRRSLELVPERPAGDLPVPAPLLPAPPPSAAPSAVPSAAPRAKPPRPPRVVSSATAAPPKAAAVLSDAVDRKRAPADTKASKPEPGGESAIDLDSDSVLRASKAK